MSPRERIQWLDETLHVVRALWRGETVTFEGRFVKVDRAKVRPVPPDEAISITVAGRGKRLLDVVATHADCWDVNAPPLEDLILASSSHLAAACERRGRDPDQIERSMWLFTRVGQNPDDSELLAQFRRLNPWFAGLPDKAIANAAIAGTPQACADRVHKLAKNLRLSLPIVDLSGLDFEGVCEQLESLAPHALV